MEQHGAFEGSSKYTLDSIERCRELSTFIKKRLAIEEEYAKSLRKLCKSVSLTPLQQAATSTTNWFWSSKKKNDTSPTEDVSKTSLWGTFYEIIDDTSQVAKSHTAFAESLQHQLLEPLSLSIREMEGNRRQLVEQGRQLEKDILEAEHALKKARRHFDKSNKEVVEYREALGRVQAARQLDEATSVEKIQARSRAAEERFAQARQTFRLQEEALKTLHTRLYSQELPRIMTKLQQQEVQRSREALSYILGLIELERRCAVMNENYANDMALKLKDINLVEDERRFTQAFMTSPLPPPPSSMVPSVARPKTPLPSLPVSLAELPRTVSMPPSYESPQESVHQRCATGSSAVLTGYVESGGGYGLGSAVHSRQPTHDAPSQPPVEYETA